MKKIGIIVILASLVVFTSCTKVKEYDEERIKDLEFTVVECEDVPEVVMQKIEEVKAEPFKFSYSDGEYLYIVIGYGEQPTGGYSIQVVDLYLSNQGVVVETEFLGPSKEDTVIMSLTYPYIVIKTEDVDSQIFYK